ncbi:hypothetical protein HCN44_008743 [Aphidius gifuensis]|uniref:Uncharacterized protein n=1 Tax=Aphidius gifuensis TaxID=684658 RepID=A0A835CW44_APHGI|nr:hypothetical protein HCN44_008743 [Aphidius gifuensis]
MTQKISTPNSSTGSVGSDKAQKEPDVDNEGEVDDLSAISHDKNSTIEGDSGIDQLLESTNDQSYNDETSTTSKNSGKRKRYLMKNRKNKTNINAQKNNSKEYQSSKTTIQKSVDEGKIKYYNINPKSSEAELDNSGKTPQIKMPEIKRGRGRPKGVKNKLKCKIGPLEFAKKNKNNTNSNDY